MNLAMFDGWINSDDDTDTSDAPTRFAINPEGVGVVITGTENSESPETIIVMRGYQEEWYTVKGNLQDTINVLKQAGKKF